MKSKFRSLFIVLAWIASIHAAFSQGARFFRISGPAAAAIIAFEADGNLIWSNAQPNATYTVQTIGSLSGGSDWVDYVQISATNDINTNLIIAFNPPTGMAFVPAGLFTMGDSLDGESDATPTNIYVSAFDMETNLVSYGQWQTVYNWATNHGYGFDKPGSGNGLNFPVQSVVWYDAVKWCNARSEMEGLTPAYYTDETQTAVYRSGDIALSNSCVIWSAGYRLPTEAEWEKAARGGLNGQRFPWGDTISESQANYDGCTGCYDYDLGPNGYNDIGNDGTTPVGSFPPNGYGFCDMAGNLEEWCWDFYGTPYGLPTTINPTGPASGGLRVSRGGAWLDEAGVVRCAHRSFDAPGGAYASDGFRCIRGL